MNNMLANPWHREEHTWSAKLRFHWWTLKCGSFAFHLWCNKIQEIQIGVSLPEKNSKGITQILKKNKTFVTIIIVIFLHDICPLIATLLETDWPSSNDTSMACTQSFYYKHISHNVDFVTNYAFCFFHNQVYRLFLVSSKISIDKSWQTGLQFYTLVHHFN